MDAVTPGAVVAAVAAVAVLLVLVPRWWFWAGWRRDAAGAYTWRLQPAGERPTDLVDAAQALGAVLSSCGQRRRAGLVLHRWTDGAAGTVQAVTVYGTDAARQLAQQVASAVGAELDGDGDLEVPSPGAPWYLRRHAWRGRLPSDDRPPKLHELADWVSSAADRSDAAWCMSIGVEPVRRWLRIELTDYHNIRSGRRDDVEGVGRGEISRCQVAVWADDPSAASTLIGGIGSQLHRLPWTVRARRVNAGRTWWALAGWSAFGTVAAATVGSVRATGGLAATWWAATGGVPAATGAAAFTVVAAAAGGLRAPVRPNGAPTRWRRLHAVGLLPVERPWWGSPTRWAAAVSYRALLGAARRDLQHERDGQRTSKGYPLRHRTVAVNTEHVAQLCGLPSAHDLGVTTVSTRRPAPAVVVARSTAAALEDGSAWGVDATGAPIWMLDADRRYGMFAVGEPGSGKTVAVARLWEQDAAARIDPAVRRRDGRMTMLWLETKGDGADLAEACLHRAGYSAGRYVRIDVAGAGGYRLELLDRSDPAATADRLVAAVVYAFEHGSVGAASQAALRRALTVALHVTPAIAADAGWGHTLPSPVRIAATLLGADADPQIRTRLSGAVHRAARDDLAARGLNPTQVDGDDRGVMQQAADDQQQQLVGPSGSPLYDAVRNWSYYEAMNARQFAELAAAPLNKLAVLAPLDSLWTPDDRPAVTLDQLLQLHGAAIINLGSSTDGRLDEATSARVASMVTHLLWDRIRTVCHGWLDAGRSVGIYADELSHLAGGGSGDDIIGELYDKGRSYGVQLAFATQRWAQLPERTAQAALGFGTRLYLQTEQVEQAEQAAADLNSGPEGPIGVADLRGLQPGHGIARLRHDGASHAVAIKIDHPLHDSAAAAAAGGWGMPALEQHDHGQTQTDTGHGGTARRPQLHDGTHR